MTSERTKNSSATFDMVTIFLQMLQFYLDDCRNNAQKVSNHRKAFFIDIKNQNRHIMVKPISKYGLVLAIWLVKKGFSERPWRFTEIIYIDSWEFFRQNPFFTKHYRKQTAFKSSYHYWSYCLCCHHEQCF